ncbi:MAG: hypothetical protein R2932_13280 [Caldilineaceae bacterium]
MDEKVLIMSHNKLCPLTGQKANAKLYNVEHHMGGKYHQLEQARAFYEPKPRHQKKSGRDLAYQAAWQNGNGTVGKQRISSQGNPRKEPQK